MQEMKPLQFKAYEYIKEKILQNAFEPEVIYSETRIAGEIGISRTPFRDAIHRLVQEGYIDIIPSKGFTLHEMNAEEVIETFQIRAAIEGYCALLAAREMETPKAKKLFENMEELLVKQRKCADKGDIDNFVNYDNQFHMQLVSYAHNSVFDDMFGMYIHRIRNLASSSLMHPGRVKETIMEHEKIVQAMKSGNRKKVDDAVTAHMERPQSIFMNEYMNATDSKNTQKRKA